MVYVESLGKIGTRKDRLFFTMNLNFDDFLESTDLRARSNGDLTLSWFILIMFKNFTFSQLIYNKFDGHITSLITLCYIDALVKFWAKIGHLFYFH